MGASTVLVLVSLTYSRISTLILTEKVDNLWVNRLPQYLENIVENPNPSFQTI